MSARGSAVGGNSPVPIARLSHVPVQGDDDPTSSASKRWLSALLAHSSDLIAVVDDQARVIYANPATKRLLGFDPDEQFGRNMLELIHPDDLESTAELFFAATRQAGTAPPTVFRIGDGLG